MVSIQKNITVDEEVNRKLEVLKCQGTNISKLFREFVRWEFDKMEGGIDGEQDVQFQR